MKTGEILIGVLLAVIMMSVSLNVAIGVVDDATRLSEITNETFNSSSCNTTVTLGYANIVVSSGVVTYTTNESAFTASTNYTLRNNGTIETNCYYVDTEADAMNNNTNYHIDYDYPGSGYVNNSASRTLISLIPLIIVAVVIAGIAAVLSKLFK